MAPVKWKWELVAHASDQVMPVPTQELRRNAGLIEGKLSTSLACDHQNFSSQDSTSYLLPWKLGSLATFTLPVCFDTMGLDCAPCGIFHR